MAESGGRRARLDTPREVRRQLVRRPSYDSDRLGVFAEQFARFMGTARFLIYMTLFVAFWITWNATWPEDSPLSFDPYPFIFLNLVLSMIAALQAPVIMMSQNRQVEHDRIDAEHDYEVNLKAEIEIMALHEKLDAMRTQEIMVILERIEALAGRMEQFENAASSRPPNA